MNYYIDFDNTLYETAKLTNKMLTNITDVISLKMGEKYESIFEYVKNNFDSTNDNIFTYGQKLAEKYGVDNEDIVNAINNAINKGKDYIFPDARMFLIKLKELGHKVYILTYLPKTNQEYQMKKINGSGIAKFFDGIIMTTEYKFNLDINYEKGIFIDDDPRDLNGLLEKNPIRVIRIRKENNKRSKIDMNNPLIEEYKDFGDIEI
ncbi:MAG: HAD hydrolase-like protein [Clostridia bacterium]|nr:HAD hydrolase-like protein [Clostridia bacterium]